MCLVRYIRYLYQVFKDCVVYFSGQLEDYSNVFFSNKRSFTNYVYKTRWVVSPKMVTN